MEQQNENTPKEPQTPAPEPENSYSDVLEPQEKNSHLMVMLAVLIVVLVVILCGLYIWGSFLTRDLSQTEPERLIENNEPETPRAKADAEIFQTVSTSDSLDAIDADVTSTDLNSLSSELDTMEAELEAAF